MQDLQFIITRNGIATTLTHSPDGWDDALIQTERSMKYYGMFRSFSIPLKFVKDGATLLKRIFYYWDFNADSASYEAKVYFQVNKLNKLTLVYEQTFKGELDCSTFKDFGHYVEINVIDGGLSSIIKAKEAQVIELPLPEDQILNYDGVVLDYEPVELSGTQPHIFDSLPVTQAAPFDIVQFGDLTQGAITVQNAGHAVSPSATDWFILCNRASYLNASVKVDATFSVSNTESEAETTVNIQIVLRVQDSLTHTDYIIKEDHITIPAGSTANIDSNINETLQINNIRNSNDGSLQLKPFDYISVFVICTSTAPSTTMQILFNECTFIGQLNATLPSIQFRVFPIYDLLIAYLAAIAPGYELVSSHFATYQDPNNLTLWTCGSAIRNQKELYISLTGEITTTYLPQVLKITLEKLFKTLDAIYPMGMGVEVVGGLETLRIEPRFHFFSAETSQNVGAVRDFKLSVATDLIYNSIKIGYPDQTYNENAGRNEVNSVQRYSVPVTRVVKELDLVAEYRADFYGIDYYRLKFATEEDTKDDEADNQIFVLSGVAVEGETYQWELLRSPFFEENGGSITGIIFPRTAYNLMLTPGHMMKRHHHWFNSFLHYNSLGYIRFVSGEKNTNVETFFVEGAVPFYGTIKENDNNIATGPAYPKLFTPYYFEFVCNLSKSDVDYILNYLAGELIAFTWKGKTFSGFLMEAKVKLSGRAEAQLKLLAAADTDLEDLVDPPAVEGLGYGQLYNYFAAVDPRNIANGDFGVPEQSDFETLIEYVRVNYCDGDVSLVGGVLKEAGLVHWLDPNVGASNGIAFSAVGAGHRLADGTFGEDTLKQVNFIGSKTLTSGDTEQLIIVLWSWTAIIGHQAEGSESVALLNTGISRRLFRTATESELLLPDGLIEAVYTGNDGKTYPLTKIGTQVWLAENLNETMFRWYQREILLTGIVPESNQVVVSITPYRTGVRTDVYLTLDETTTLEDIYDQMIIDPGYQALEAAGDFKVTFVDGVLFYYATSVTIIYSEDGCFAYQNQTSMFIPEVQDNEAWAALTTGGRCYYDNDSNNA